MATTRRFRLVAALAAAFMFCVQPAFAQTVTSSATTIVTSTTTEVADFERVYKKHVKSMPAFCRKKKTAQMHCSIAPVLYDAAQIWEGRARNELIAKRKCNKDLGECENMHSAPPPVAPDDPGFDLGVVGDVLIYVGMAAAAGGLGYLIGRATSD